MVIYKVKNDGTDRKVVSGVTNVMGALNKSRVNMTKYFSLKTTGTSGHDKFT